MEVNGKIKMIGETQVIGTSNFKKREIVVTTDEQYPQHISIEFVQDKCDLLNNFKEGQNAKISINLRGREWINPQGEAKYFNQIQGWRIEGLVDSINTTPSQPFEPAGALNEDEIDDLPFN